MSKEIHSGFTLIELMVVVSIVAILAMIAVPGLQAFLYGNRVSTSANSMVAALQVARSEAIKRGIRVTVCRKTSGANTCSTASGAWNNGWLVFVDANANGTFDAGDELLRVEDGLAGSTYLTPSPATIHFVSYLPSGITPSTATLGAFAVCHANHLGTSKGRTLTIAQTGRPAVTPYNPSSCP